MYLTQQVRALVRPWWHRRRSAVAFRKLGGWMPTQPDLPGPVLYDIGARWGASPPYDRLAEVAGFRSVAFEPDTKEAEKLRQDQAFNYVCPVALGGKVGKRTLYIARDPGSSSLFQPNPAEFARHTTWRGFETIGELEVPVEPLDGAIARHELPPPDYLKIDCEGAEGEILEGASHALDGLCGLTFEARLRNFYMAESETLPQLLDRMFKRDFVCLRLDPVGAWLGAVMMFDAVMVRHPGKILDRRQFVLCLLFCLLHGNWAYALHMAELRARHFDCAETLRILGLA